MSAAKAQILLRTADWIVNDNVLWLVVGPRLAVCLIHSPYPSFEMSVTDPTGLEEYSNTYRILRHSSEG